VDLKTFNIVSRTKLGESSRATLKYINVIHKHRDKMTKRKIPVCPECKTRKKGIPHGIEEHSVKGYMKCWNCGKVWRFIK